MILKVINLVASLAIVLAFWFLPANLDTTIGGASPGTSSVPEYLMHEVRNVQTKEGKLEVEMFADMAEFRLGLEMLKATKVHGDFYNEAGEITKLQSDKADYYMKTRMLHLMGNMVCETSDHFFLRGPLADYDMNRRFLQIPQDVNGNTQDNELKFWSDKGESFIDTKTANLYGDARADYMSKKDGLTKIRGDRALIDRNDQAATFFENVKIRQEKYDIDSRIASLFYAKDTKSVQYMVAKENVKIREKSGRYSNSQEAQFFSPTNTIVLLGFPSVYDGDDVITGDRITMFKNTGVVEVTSINAATSEQSITQSPDKRDQARQVEPELTEEDEELVP